MCSRLQTHCSHVVLDIKVLVPVFTHFRWELLKDQRLLITLRMQTQFCAHLMKGNNSTAFFFTQKPRLNWEFFQTLHGRQQIPPPVL